MEKWNIKLELGQFEIQYGGQYLTTISGNWYHWIPCPPQKNIHLDTRIKSVAALCPDAIANVDFKWRPF